MELTTIYTKANSISEYHQLMFQAAQNGDGKQFVDMIEKIGQKLGTKKIQYKPLYVGLSPDDASSLPIINNNGDSKTLKNTPSNKNVVSNDVNSSQREGNPSEKQNGNNNDIGTSDNSNRESVASNDTTQNIQQKVVEHDGKGKVSTRTDDLPESSQDEEHKSKDTVEGSSGATNDDTKNQDGDNANQPGWEFNSEKNVKLVEAIRILIENGGDVNAKDSTGRSLLHWAVLLGSTDIIQVLFHAGADLNICNNKGSTPLMYAFLFNRVAIVDTFMHLDHKLKDLSVRKATNAGLLAGLVGLTGLPSIGCDIVDKYKSAVTIGHSPQYLGLKPTSPWSSNVDVTITNAIGCNALHIAATYLKDDPQVIEALIQNGCVANAKSEAELKPIHLAAMTGKAKMLEVLVMTDSELNDFSKKGYHPLYLGACKNYLSVVQVLVKAGCNVNTATKKEGYTALHIAALRNYLDIAKLLISAGAYVDIPSKKNVTPLALAKKKPENVELIQLLQSSNCKRRSKKQNAVTATSTNSNFSQASNGASQSGVVAASASPQLPPDAANNMSPVPTQLCEFEEGAASQTLMGECQYKVFCENFVKTLGVSVLMRGKPAKKYAIPHGWVRIAIAVDQRLSQDIFNSYHVAFHGTQAKVVKSIVESCQLLLPGDTTSTGYRIPVIENHCKDGAFSLIANGKDSTGVTKLKLINRHSAGCKCGCSLFYPKKLFFTSPSIRYCEHVAYSGYGTNYKAGKMKCVLQVRQKPGTYKILNETVGATKRGEVIDLNFDNNELAWFTSCRYPAIVPHGIMVKYVKSTPK